MDLRLWTGKLWLLGFSMKICACENCLKVVGECCLPSYIEMIIKLILIIKCCLYDLCNNSSQNVRNIEPLLPFHVPWLFFLCCALKINLPQIRLSLVEIFFCLESSNGNVPLISLLFLLWTYSLPMVVLSRSFAWGKLILKAILWI